MDEIPALRSGEPSGRRQKRAFTGEEDTLLQQLVERFGEQNWTEIERQMPGRTSRQCRERWNLYLSPAISLAPWSQEEDFILIRLHQIIGPKWTVIAKNFPKRTPGNVKNRHKQLQRRMQRLSRFNPPTSFTAANETANPHSIVVPLGHSVNDQNVAAGTT